MAAPMNGELRSPALAGAWATRRTMAISKFYRSLLPGVHHKAMAFFIRLRAMCWPCSLRMMLSRGHRASDAMPVSVI